MVATMSNVVNIPARREFQPYLCTWGVWVSARGVGGVPGVSGRLRGGGGGGGTPIYKPYRYVPPQRVPFSSISSLK